MIKACILLSLVVMAFVYYRWLLDVQMNEKLPVSGVEFFKISENLQSRQVELNLSNEQQTNEKSIINMLTWNFCYQTLVILDSEKKVIEKSGVFTQEIIKQNNLSKSFKQCHPYKFSMNEISQNNNSNLQNQIHPQFNKSQDISKFIHLINNQQTSENGTIKDTFRGESTSYIRKETIQNIKFIHLNYSEKNVDQIIDSLIEIAMQKQHNSFNDHQLPLDFRLRIFIEYEAKIYSLTITPAYFNAKLYIHMILYSVSEDPSCEMMLYCYRQTDLSLKQIKGYLQFELKVLGALCKLGQVNLMNQFK